MPEMTKGTLSDALYHNRYYKFEFALFYNLAWLPSPLSKGAYILILTIWPYTGAARATFDNFKSRVTHTSSRTKPSLQLICSVLREY